MAGVWRPNKSPPVLQKFCHLSLDAQKVIAALYQDFHQAKAEILASSAQELIRPQYASEKPPLASIENRQDKASDDSYFRSHQRYNNVASRQNRHEYPDSVSARPSAGQDGLSAHLVGSETTAMPIRHENSKAAGSKDDDELLSLLNIDNSNEGQYSPPVETRDFLILSQFNADSGTTVTDNDNDGAPRALSSDFTAVDGFTLPDAETLLQQNDKILSSSRKTMDRKDAEGRLGLCSERSLFSFDNNTAAVTRQSTGDRINHVVGRDKMAAKHTSGPSKTAQESPLNSVGDAGNWDKKVHVAKKFHVPGKIEEEVTVQGQKRQSSELDSSRKTKKLMLDSSSEALSPTKLLMHKASDIVEIDYCSEEKLERIFTSILEESEILIIMVYADRSTQLRENVFDKETKKKSVNHLKKDQIADSFAICTTDNPAVYLFPAEISKHEKLEKLRSFWNEILKKDSVRKIGFRVKELFVALLTCLQLDKDKNISWTVLDASVAAWLLDPDQSISSFDHLLTQLSMPKQAAGNGLCASVLQNDAAFLSASMKKLFQKLQSRNLWNLFMCLETRLLPVLACMELREIYVSVDTLIKTSELLKKELAWIEQRAHKAAGHAFVINSHHQLRQVLFEELHLDSKLDGAGRLQKTSVTRETSTSESVLQQLQDFHPLPAIVLEYRQFQKLKSCYVDGILGCVRDSHLCAHWDQVSTGTGRLASYQPNIQAIPKQPVTIHDHRKSFIAGAFQSESEGNAVEFHPRDIFISSPNWSFLAADFQQIEFRLFSHLADDPVLLKVFSDNTPDIFKALAAEWMSKDVSMVNDADREQTKRVVYSVIYGIGKDKLSKYLKCSPGDAKAIMSSFLGKFPAIGKFTKSCVEFCHMHGYTCSIMQRRRLFPNIYHKNPAVRAQAERQCVNFCVQGSAADICKAAMLQVEKMLSEEPELKARLLVQIHDELLFEVADSNLQTVSEKVRCVMEKTENLCGPGVQLRVPIRVTLSTGKTWGHMQPIP